MKRAAIRIALRARRLVNRVVKPRTLGVRAVLLDGEGRVALVKHHYVAGWHLPGGGVDRREGFAAALARELSEEVAVERFTVERILGAYHSFAEGKDDNILVYVARADGPIRAADEREIREARWFAIDALPPDLSPGTARRLAEYRAGALGGGRW
jgi:ADP-ribose pyrophosphatase YjhB (NUDIX family)